MHIYFTEENWGQHGTKSVAIFCPTYSLRMHNLIHSSTRFLILGNWIKFSLLHCGFRLPMITCFIETVKVGQRLPHTHCYLYLNLSQYLNCECKLQLICLQKKLHGPNSEIILTDFSSPQESSLIASSHAAVQFFCLPENLGTLSWWKVSVAFCNWTASARSSLYAPALVSPSC